MKICNGYYFIGSDYGDNNVKCVCLSNEVDCIEVNYLNKTVFLNGIHTISFNDIEDISRTKADLEKKIDSLKESLDLKNKDYNNLSKAYNKLSTAINDVKLTLFEDEIKRVSLLECEVRELREKLNRVRDNAIPPRSSHYKW